MIFPSGQAVLQLVSDASADADPETRDQLTALAGRLEGPLRLAIIGMVKAGKSTLLNAMIGEEIAPTDAGECTRIVTWYRYGRTPRVTAHLHDGGSKRLPVARAEGRLTLDLGDLSGRDVHHLDVEWPVPALRDVTLIDTPGIASLSEGVSARSTDAMIRPDGSSDADAVLYLSRQVHTADIAFLEAFRDTAAGPAGGINAVAVLSRADEVAAGRIESLVSARAVAERYRDERLLNDVVSDILPVAGLLAQSARTMRESEFSALNLLAGLGKPERDKLLRSADRFAAAATQGPVDVEERRALLARFGIFGIRLATVLIRGGIDDATELAHELARRSGLDDLLRIIATQFRARADVLKAAAVLASVDAMLRDGRLPADGDLAIEVERIRANAHEFRELRALAALHSTESPLSGDELIDAERLIGGSGAEARERLGLDESAEDSEVREAARREVDRWRTAAEDPIRTLAASRICRVVVRSCEGVLAGMPDESAGQRRIQLVLA